MIRSCVTVILVFWTIILSTLAAFLFHDATPALFAGIIGIIAIAVLLGERKNRHNEN